MNCVIYLFVCFIYDLFSGHLLFVYVLFLLLTTCLSTQRTSKKELHCIIIIITIPAVVMSVANCFSSPIIHVAVALYCVFNICIMVFLV
jgi:hypothetical protein